MTTRSAQDILRRLMVIVPAASREGGADINDLARRLDVSVSDIHQDLKELRERADYHLPGLGDDIQVLAMDGERIELWTKGLLQRPVRLSPREALALDLGLRILAGQRELQEARDALSNARERLMTSLPVPPERRSGSALPSRQLHLPGLERPLPEAIEESALRGCVLSVEYQPVGRPASWRSVAPRRLVRAEGAWYLLAFDLEREAIRAFRLDRMIEARATDRTAPAPSEDEDRQMDELVRDGTIFSARGPSGGTTDVEVHYAPTIARWIRERGWKRSEEAGDGGLVVTHEVADPDWLVAHVLEYAGEARVLSPPEFAARVSQAALAVAQTHGSSFVAAQKLDPFP